jgi:hypothetical protein
MRYSVLQYRTRTLTTGTTPAQRQCLLRTRGSVSVGAGWFPCFARGLLPVGMWIGWHARQILDTSCPGPSTVCSGWKTNG